MDRKLFQNLIEVLDKIIKANSNLKALFEVKRELLKSAKPDDLGVTDNKIIAVNNQILKLENERKNLAISMKGEDTNMSGFIELAANEAPDFVESLKERKVKIY